MNSKIEFWLTRIVVVAYGIACLAAIMYDVNKNEMTAKCKYEVELTPATSSEGALCVWLKELQGDVEFLEDYLTIDTVMVSHEQLEHILNPSNYTDPGDFMTMASFMPIAKIEYNNCNREAVCGLYSFVSCEVKFYINGELLKKKLLTTPHELSNFFESFK